MRRLYQRMRLRHRCETSPAAIAQTPVNPSTTFFNGKGWRIGIRFNDSSVDALFDDFGGGKVP